MGKKGFFLLFFLSIILNGFSQQDSIGIYKEIPKVKGEQIALDNRGFIYIISENSLYKYSSEGEFLFSYQNAFLGTISDIDLSSPMKIMLFYQESGKIIFLDEHLSPITEELDFASKQYHSVLLAAYSTSNHIWIYNEIERNLIKLDFYLNEQTKTHHSIPDFNPIQLLVLSEKTIVMNNPKTGILFFDSFGTYIKTIGIRTSQKIQMDNQFIYYLKDNNLHRYDYKRMDETIIPLRIENLKQVIVYKDRFILLTREGSVFIAQ